MIIVIIGRFSEGSLSCTLLCSLISLIKLIIMLLHREFKVPSFATRSSTEITIIIFMILIRSMKAQCHYYKVADP